MVKHRNILLLDVERIQGLIRKGKALKASPRPLGTI